jgi:hypothetical protein
MTRRRMTRAKHRWQEDIKERSLDAEEISIFYEHAGDIQEQVFHEVL